MAKRLRRIMVWFCVMVLAQTAYAATGVNVGQEAPDFTLKNLAGKSVSLKDFRGEKVVVLDFWASWCAPCLRAIPELNRIQKDYDGKNVQVLGINVGQRPTAVLSVKKKYMVKYPILLDLNGNVAKEEYRVRGIPNLILVDKDGVVQYNGHNPARLKEVLRRLAGR
jgi:thiol-disulfide isomerase/thioredoxin